MKYPNRYITNIIYRDGNIHTQPRLNMYKDYLNKINDLDAHCFEEIIYNEYKLFEIPVNFRKRKNGNTKEDM